MKSRMLLSVLVFDPEAMQGTRNRPARGSDPAKAFMGGRPDASDTASPKQTGQPKPKGLRVRGSYMTPEATPLHVEVQPTGPQVIDLNVE